MKTICVLASAFCFFGTPALADVLDVSPSSTLYPQIDDAIQAAVAGDIIRVSGGFYDSFTVDNKRLVFVVKPNTGVVGISGTTVIENVPRGSAVSIAGFVFHGTAGRALSFQNSAGSIRLRDCLATGGDQMFAVHMVDCGDVAFFDSEFLGGSIPSQQHSYDGGSGLFGRDSNVSAYSCIFEGKRGSNPINLGEPGGRGGNGISLAGGRLYAMACTLIGGDGGRGAQDAPGLCCTSGGAGGDGFGGHSGSEAWFLDCVFNPGTGGPAGTCTVFTCGPNPGFAGPDGVDATSGTFLPGIATSFRATALMQDNSPLTLTFTGMPGAMVGWISADRPAYSFRAFRGAYLVYPGSSNLLQYWHFAGRIGPSGTLTVQLNVGDSPAFAHRNPYFQGVYRDRTNGRIYYTGSTQTVILDSAW